MKSYKELKRALISSILDEAKVSGKNVEKAIDIFVRLLQKKLGTKLYQFGGKGHSVEIKGGIGFLFLYGSDHSAIRFNYISGDITSLTLWDRFSLDKKGDRTISFENMGLLSAGKKLIDVIASDQSKKTGTIYFAVNEETSIDPEEEEKLIAEAARITPKEAAQIIFDEIGRDRVALSRMKYKEISDILKGQGYSIPSGIKNVKTSVTGVSGVVYDLAAILFDDVTGDSQASITIRSGDPITSGKSAAIDRSGMDRADKMNSAVKQIINDPTPQQMEEMADKVDSLFHDMTSLVKVVCRGARNALFIYGLPGGGKSFLVMKTLKEEGLKRNKDFIIAKGKITTAELYRTLFMHRQKNKIIVFDDIDSVFATPDSSNLLKAALDSTDERYISWFTRQTFNVSRLDDDEREAYNQEVDAAIDDPESRIKFPSEFLYEGRVIFISNLNASKVEPAILNRAASINMDLTFEEMLYRIESILEHLGNPSVPMSKKKEILDFIKTDEGTIRKKGISMRTYVAAEDLYLSGLPDWQRIMKYS